MEGDDGFELRVDPSKDKTALIAKNNKEVYGAINNPQPRTPATITFQKIERVCSCKGNNKCTCHPDHLSGSSTDAGCCTLEYKEENTDAYGNITFIGFKRNTSAQYVRLSYKTDPADVTEHFAKQWQFGNKSQILISIPGTSSSYTIDEGFEKRFREGLYEVARMSSALVLTNGEDSGIAKVVGLSLKKKTQVDSTTPAYDRERSVRLIGILPWGILPKSADLVKPNAKNNVKLKLKLPKHRFLNQNHSYFLLVDDGSRDEIGIEFEFKHNLEKYILENGVPGTKGAMRKHVGIKLVVGGDAEIIDQVKVTLQSKMPVIVFRGTGFAADLLTTAFNLKPLEDCALKDLEEHQKLIKRINSTYPDFTMEKTVECYDTIMECLQYKSYLTFSKGGDETRLDQMILNAFLQAYKSEHSEQSEEEKAKSISNQLMLAIQWGCYNYVKILLKEVDEDLQKKKSDEAKNVDILVHNLVHAISISRHKEARILIEYVLDHFNGDLTGVFTEETMLWLYQSKLKKKKLNILHVLTEKEEVTIKDMNEDFLEMLKEFGDINNEDFKDDVFMQLFFYSILANMQFITVLFLFYGGNALTKILMAFKLYGSVKAYYLDNKKTEEKYLTNRLAVNEEYFKDLATRMLDECTEQQPYFTRRLLCQEPINFGSKSCLALAAATNHVNFVSHSTCQLMLTENWWCGRILLKGDSWFMHGVKVFSCLFPPMFLLLQYKTREMEKVEGKVTSEYESNQLRANFKRKQEKKKTAEKIKDAIKQVYYKGNYFYNAPITKCTANVFSYILFLGFFAFLVTHKLENRIKPPEWIVAFYILAFIVEEIRQIVQAPVGRTIFQKIKKHMSSFLNLLDVIAVSIFIVGFVLRSYTDKLIETRILYAADIFFWIIRLLSLFAISPDLGPYVEMIKRMITDLLYFVFVLAVFLLAYGIARFSILSPMNDSTFAAVSAIFSVPYKQMYADAMDEAELTAPGNMTVFNTSYKNVVVPISKILMAGYTLMAAVLLINLLIARFSFVYDEVQGDSTKIWKFNRYFIMQEYHDRSAVPMPFSIITNLYSLVSDTIHYSNCCTHSHPSALTADEKSELDGFERECLTICRKAEIDKIVAIKNQKKDKQLDEEETGEGELNPALTARLALIEDGLQTIISQENENVGRGRPLSVCDFYETLKADVYYPLTAVKRVFVSPENIAWNVDFPDYKPNKPKTFFVANDDNSTEHERNPKGRTGLVGKGLLRKLGPNKIVETIVTRWKPGLTGIAIGKGGLKVLQVLVVKNENNSDHINLPIGAVTKCESHQSEERIPPVLSQLFHIDILSDKSLHLDKERKMSYIERCEEIFVNGIELYKGVIDDPRNTDDAWIESVVINYHDQDGRVISKYLESKKAYHLHLEWIDISSKILLAWRYHDYMKKITQHCNAQF